ncbi:MAG: thioredoxin family protein [Pseudomonadota bacterium]
MDAIDWNSDPHAAFALARGQGLPVLLYWGARWCPPCNRIKASVLATPAFGALSSRFVALHIDGDHEGAQQQAAQLKLRSYPTLVLYRPDGAEITRLPCELDGPRFLQALGLALGATHTAAQSLQAALEATRALSGAEWQLLSLYSWDTDEQQLLAGRDGAAVLARLAHDCSDPEAGVRLEWHAQHAAAQGKRGVDRPAARAAISAMLGDARAVAPQMDLVNSTALDLVRFLSDPDSAERQHLCAAWAGALAVLETDPGVSVGDQLQALRTRVRMLRIGALAAPDSALLRARAASAMASADSPALRHVMRNTAAGMLSDAGLLDEAQALLLGGLDDGHAPYYFMHNLAALAKKRGDAAAMVLWYDKAWQCATGSSTRLQWGATCLGALLGFAPHDAPRIEALAQSLLAALPAQAWQRDRSQLERIARDLAQWGGSGPMADALRAAAQIG